MSRQQKQKTFTFSTKVKIGDVTDQLNKYAEALEPYGGLSIIKYFLPDDIKEKLDDFIDLEDAEINEDFSDLIASQKLKASFKIIKASIAENDGSNEEQFADSLIDYINDKKLTDAKKRLNENVKMVLSEIKPLERSYRSAQILFANAGKANGEIERLHFVNATMSQLQAKSARKSKTNFAYTIMNTLKTGYDDSDLAENYSLFQIAGYLGEGLKEEEVKPVIERWAEIANNNKVLLLTDFKECKSLKELKDFKKLKLADAKNTDLRSVLMFGNYGVARKKHDNYEDEDFLIYPSSVACGLFISDETISQAKAGATFGKAKETLGVNKNSFYTEAKDIRNEGLNVLYFSRSAKVTHLEGNTALYINKKDLTNKQASVVRTKFFMEKFFQNYLNKITFAGINSSVLDVAEGKVKDSLQDLKEEGLIRKFSNINAAQNPKSKDQLKVTFNVEFIFAAEEIELNIITND